MDAPPALVVEQWPIARLLPYAGNPRKNDTAVDKMVAAIREYGFRIPVVAKSSGEVVDGHLRLKAAFAMGLPEVPVALADDLSDEQIRAFRLLANRSASWAEWDYSLLAGELEALKAGAYDLGLTGFDAAEIDGIFGLSKPGRSLAERFGVAPFSVLNAREGWWQDRKRAWLALGIKSEIGREDNLLEFSDTANERDPMKRAAAARAKAATKTAPGGGSGANSAWMHKQTDGSYGARDAETSQTGTSIFDPVLTELCYRWFCPPKGMVLDPFAGGSVRGIVASKLGRGYTGIDLRAEQVAANEAQAAAICGEGEPRPRWLCGDAIAPGKLLGKAPADFLFSCPPYGDLERYSDDPRDLSTMEYPAFLSAYGKIIAEAAKRLRPDRFACFVVSDIRDEKGRYRGLPGHTIDGFRAAGLALYNEAILVTATGSLAIRVVKAFQQSRKLGRTHQNVLCFVKGDERKAAAAIGEIEFGDAALPVEEALPPLGGEV